MTHVLADQLPLTVSRWRALWLCVAALCLLALSAFSHGVSANVNTYTACYFIGEECVDTEPRIIEGQLVVRECWEYQRDYTCFAEESSSCNIEELEQDGWSRTEIHSEEYTLLDNGEWTKLPTSWVEVWETSVDNCELNDVYGCVLIEETETRTEYLCHTGPMPRCINDDDCLLLEYECIEEEEGLCLAVTQEYSCVREMCNSSDDINELLGEDGEGFEKALAVSALFDLIQEEGSMIDGQLRLFSGQPRICNSLTNSFIRYIETQAAILTGISAYFGPWWSALLTAAAGGSVAQMANDLKCCQDNPENVKLNPLIEYCDQDDVSLAAARLGKRAYQVWPAWVPTDNCLTILGPFGPPNAPAAGDINTCRQITSHWTRPWSYLNQKIQVDRYQAWCEFDSMLARIIHEQGREQINEMAAMGAGNAQSIQMNFSFWAPTGRWTNQYFVNQNRVAAWQWDQRCQTEEGGGLEMMGSITCPVFPDVPLAVCSKPETGCGAMPVDPFDRSSGWDIYFLPAEDHAVKPVNRYVIPEGGCFDNSACQYTIHAWPAGRSGQLRAPIDMTWPMVFNRTAWGDYRWAYGDVHIEAFTWNSLDDPQNPYPRLRYCRGSTEHCRTANHGAWTELNVPNPISSAQHTILFNPHTTLTGECSGNDCHYRAMFTLDINAKPWFDYSEKQYRPCMLRVFGRCLSRASTIHDRRYQPLCEGFTLDEFMALDMDKIDLSEYVESLLTATREDARRAAEDLLFDLMLDFEAP